MRTILLCSDMDRTLIPNGDADESPRARQRFARLMARPEMRLVYVTGRDRRLAEAAIDQYGLPAPMSAICDVGTTLYHVRDSKWTVDRTWEEEIGRDWQGHTHGGISRLLADIHPGQFCLQPPENQRPFKISYFADIALPIDPLRKKIAGRLEREAIPANIICSVEDVLNRHLIDILPPRANKLLAIRFLVHRQGLDLDRVVFSGDSGNDLDVLTSGIQAILVGNAAADVRQTTLERIKAKGLKRRLYLATGGFEGMNGNYSAGVLEGVAHFFPETASGF